jgi:hypothetical protein
MFVLNYSGLMAIEIITAAICNITSYYVVFFVTAARVLFKQIKIGLSRT